MVTAKIRYAGIHEPEGPRRDEPWYLDRRLILDVDFYLACDETRVCHAQRFEFDPLVSIDEIDAKVTEVARQIREVYLRSIEVQNWHGSPIDINV